MIESLEFVVYCHPERFWRKVGKSTDCWHWMAGKTSDGYGGYWFKGKMVAAHRFSWALVHSCYREWRKRRYWARKGIAA
jgi:hypothetical protein